MMEYKLEPLIIDLDAPKGNYEITLSLKSHSDTVFSVYEDTAGFVVNDKGIGENESTDIKFSVKTDGGISVKIYCDGNLTATAAAEYIP